MHRSWQKRLWIAGGIAAAMVPLTGAMASLPGSDALGSAIRAEAAVQTVHAVRAVDLRKTAGFGANVERKEGSGTTFAVLPGSTITWWHVQDPYGNTGYVIRKPYWVQTAQLGTSNNTSVGPVQNSAQGYATLPPGVHLDSLLQPVATLGASTVAKEQAVLQVAASKLGTPYIWGHNEDRGQYGFDCSNFTAYVYHHALGYKMSGASRVQASSVGWQVSKANMQPGDLIIFNNGGHVGIYAGNDRMIEEGGGLGRVGYLSVSPNSYWGRHITAVKRMF